MALNHGILTRFIKKLYTDIVYKNIFIKKKMVPVTSILIKQKKKKIIVILCYIFIVSYTEITL